MSSASLRRLSLLAWLASIVLILVAGVLLLIGGGDSVRPGDVDLSVERDTRGRSIGLGTVGMVAILGAAAFGGGAWARMRAEEVDRREASRDFGVRPRRPRPGGMPGSAGSPADGTILPPSSGAHDDLPPAHPDADPDADPEKP